MSLAANSFRSTIANDTRRVIRLAVPVALAELGWMAMTVVDTIMVGRLGPEAIGAIGLGSSAFYTLAIFGMGLLLGLDTLVSQSFGAGDRDDCHRSLAQGVYGAVFITVPLMAIFSLMPPAFYALGIDVTVSGMAGSFVRTLNFSTFPLLLYAAFRRYLQGIGHVRPVMFVLLSANLINWFFNWLLIQGHWGLPTLGVVGSALSTCVARAYMALMLGFFIFWFERGLKPGFRNLLQLPDWRRLKLLAHIGLPAATQILLEVGAFGAAAVLAGKLNAIALAAHQIAINCAAVTYMVPLGVASAGAVAVGQAVGRGEPETAKRDGWIAIALACGFMICSAITFIAIPRAIIQIYTRNEQVLQIGAGLLAIAALFQLFDGIQTVATGVLRGVADTRTPMMVNLVGYWAFGLPIGYLLCFRMGRGVYGLWWGLTVALIAIALVLLSHWQRKSLQLFAAIHRTARA